MYKSERHNHFHYEAYGGNSVTMHECYYTELAKKPFGVEVAYLFMMDPFNFLFSFGEYLVRDILPNCLLKSPVPRRDSFVRRLAPGLTARRDFMRTFVSPTDLLITNIVAYYKLSPCFFPLTALHYFVCFVLLIDIFTDYVDCLKCPCGALLFK